MSHQQTKSTICVLTLGMFFFGNESRAQSSARWFQDKATTSSSWIVEDGSLLARRTYEPFEPEISRATLIWSHARDSLLELHLNVEDLPEETHRHVLRFGNSSLQFLTRILWPHQREQDPFGEGSALGFGFGENEKDREEAPKPPPKPRGWVASVDSLEKGRTALKAIQVLHQLPDSHAIDGTLIYGLGPFIPENPNQKTGWFNYFPAVQDRVSHEVSDEGVLTIRYAAQPFPLPLVAARLRVDSERNDRWWLEFDIECGSGALEFMGHFQDFFFLAIDGVAHRGFSFEARATPLPIIPTIQQPS